MKRIISILALFCLLFPTGAAIAEITQFDRLLQRPEWDGAVMPGSWVEGALRVQQWDTGAGDADVWMLGPTFITSLTQVPELELGGRVDLINFDPDRGDSETGVSDIELWGKYQFFKNSQIMLSAGLVLTLPTGSDDVIHPRASGEFNLEAFAAGRYTVSSTVVVIGHLGLRKNSDMEVEVGGVDFDVDGELQLMAGGGAIFEIMPQLNLIGELNVASEPYEDFDSDIQLRGGAEYEFTNDLSFRGGLSLGLDDGAPEWELMAGVAYSF